MDYRILSLDEPNSQIAEIYRLIRTNIEYSTLDSNNKVINITSTTSGEAKSTTSANLAVMCANKLNRVLLIDLDLRSPSIHKLFKIKNNVGVTNLLLDYVDKGDAVDIFKYAKKIDHDNINNELYVITTGHEIANPTEVLGSNKLRGLINHLQTQFDQVIIDSSPSGVIPDGLVTSTLTSGTIYVVESGRTKIEQARQTIDKLRSMNVNLLGVILTKVKGAGGTYGQYYGYGEIDSSKSKRIKID